MAVAVASGTVPTYWAWVRLLENEGPTRRFHRGDGRMMATTSAPAAHPS